MSVIFRAPVVTAIALLLGTAQAIAGVLYLGDAPYLSVLLFLAALFCVLGSAKLWRDNCFESRFGLAIVAVSSIAGHILSLTVGLPGSQFQPWSGLNAILSIVSLALAVLLLGLLLPHLFSGGDSQPPTDLYSS
ncbi:MULTISPECIES: hypothetical protein [unclassified Arthrobacter]|uniref:hypothetical protein n=1 Tax=unclassified Arthrobacter TaxID=235627 RepID=UPI001491146E|nr:MULTISPECIES: hypothetical protein [unclassified Arthrobacter]MBE0009766.1 hypothetical protein [Arthrobacter sp. AET 35A]NOJ63542.1 hypothetical protein [Arthrobacter sp. 147(2020)]